MTKTQQIELLRNALKELMENSTFSAYAGDNCRQCPRAHDGGCEEPHDPDCPYGMAIKAAETALEQTIKKQGGFMDIPKDKNHPGNVGQCDDCGGHGCAMCDQKGWLLSDHPKVRKCARPACGNIIAPAWVPVYCSGQCALMDA